MSKAVYISNKVADYMHTANIRENSPSPTFLPRIGAGMQLIIRTSFSLNQFTTVCPHS